MPLKEKTVEVITGRGDKQIYLNALPIDQIRYGISLLVLAAFRTSIQVVRATRLKANTGNARFSLRLPSFQTPRLKSALVS